MTNFKSWVNIQLLYSFEPYFSTTEIFFLLWLVPIYSNFSSFPSVVFLGSYKSDKFFHSEIWRKYEEHKMILKAHISTQTWNGRCTISMELEKWLFYLCLGIIEFWMHENSVFFVPVHILVCCIPAIAVCTWLNETLSCVLISSYQSSDVIATTQYLTYIFCNHRAIYISTRSHTRIEPQYIKFIPKQQYCLYNCVLDLIVMCAYRWYTVDTTNNKQMDHWYLYVGVSIVHFLAFQAFLSS